MERSGGKTPGARLQTYRQKRDFKRSPEPSGARRRQKAKTGPIFCVQKHLASHLHYDLRLEHRGVLLSWALPKGPSLNPRDKRLAVQVEDHPLDYAEFEGVIPEGYGAGIVMLWDRGTWTALSEDVEAALEAGELKFQLEGTKLKGSWVLVRSGTPRQWLLIKHRDDWSGDLDVTAVAPLSVRSFKDFADILAAEKPALWQSHLPARGGATGAMLKEVIEQAAAIRAGREQARPGKGRARRT